MAVSMNFVACIADLFELVCGPVPIVETNYLNKRYVQV